MVSFENARIQWSFLKFLSSKTADAKNALKLFLLKILVQNAALVEQ